MTGITHTPEVLPVEGSPETFTWVLTRPQLQLLISTLGGDDQTGNPAAGLLRRQAVKVAFHTTQPPSNPF
jgi:hypothetical protein